MAAVAAGVRSWELGVRSQETGVRSNGGRAAARDREGPASNDRVRVDEGPDPLHNVDQEIVIVELRDQRHLAITIIQ